MQHEEDSCEDLLYAIDAEDVEAVRRLTSVPSSASRTRIEQYFRTAVAHENIDIITALLNSPLQPSISIIHEIFRRLVMDGLKPHLIFSIQPYVAPKEIAEHHRTLERIRRTSEAYYLVDDIELDTLKAVKKKIDVYRTARGGGGVGVHRSRHLNMMLSSQAWINDVLLDACQMRRKLLLHQLLRMAGPLRPSQSTVNRAFRLALERDAYTIAVLLAAEGDHRAIVENGWLCIDQTGYDDAFENATDLDDLEGVRFLLNGRLGWRPTQGLIDVAYREREVCTYRQELGARTEGFYVPARVATVGGEPQTAADITSLLSVHCSAECAQQLFEEKKTIRQQFDNRQRQRRMFRQGGGVDIHEYSDVTIVAPPLVEGQERTVQPHRGRRRQNTLNQAVLDHIESRVTAHSGPSAEYDIHSMTSELTVMIMTNFSSPSEQDVAVRIVGDVLNESTLSIFSSTLSFLRMLSSEPPMEQQGNGHLLNIWIQGFLSESIVMHSCNPGALERVVTGLRGLGDSQLDSIFGQAEGPHLARAFLRGTMNIFYTDSDSNAKRRAESNARSLATVLVESFGANTNTTEGDILGYISRYAADAITSYGVQLSLYEADIAAIAEMIADNYDTHLRPFVQEVLVAGSTPSSAGAP